MKLTDAMKEWLVKNCDVKADADDDTFRKAAGEALGSGSLTMEKMQDLLKDPDEDKATEFEKKMDSIADGLAKLTEAMTAKASGDSDEEKEAKEKAEKEAKEKAEKEAKEKAAKQKAGPTAMEKMIGRIGGTPTSFDGKAINIRVKEAAERYTHDRKSMVYPSSNKNGKPHPFAGQQMMSYDEHGRALHHPSDRDKAVAGAYAKFSVASAHMKSRKIAFHQLPEHDKELLLHGMDEYEWGGATDGGDFADIKGRKLTDGEKQALIDDAVSGGFEAAPIVFDDMVIQTPLLNGELFPLVNVVPIDRGRRIEGVSTGTVTATWGGVDDSTIPLFNTALYVTAFDTTIFRWEGCIRIGLDFLSDTPIDFGTHVTNQYGERLLEDLDDVVASGNGTTQPLGIINSAGTTVAFGGATNLGNYETLRSSVTKQEHQSAVAASAVFCGTEVSYWRARGIPVGGTDTRRIMGYDYSSYNWMERPYKINNSLTNQQIFYAVLKRYRMYRRRGLTMRSSTEGDTLIRRNEILICATARYGGQLERGACAAMTITAPA